MGLGLVLERGKRTRKEHVSLYFSLVWFMLLLNLGTRPGFKSISEDESVFFVVVLVPTCEMRDADSEESCMNVWKFKSV